jgi:hypothetical protein
MKKVVVAAVMALLLTSVSGFAETGIGATVYYPAFMEKYSGNSPLDHLLVGANLRSKHSILLLDISGLYELGNDLIMGFGDVGLCFDLFLFRIGVLGGVNVRYSWNFDSFLWAPNVKADVDLKLGPATVGVSAVVPLPALVLDDSEEVATMRGYTGVSLNVLFWF